jgi:hypothetical protein
MVVLAMFVVRLAWAYRRAAIAPSRRAPGRGASRRAAALGAGWGYGAAVFFPGASTGCSCR